MKKNILYIVFAVVVFICFAVSLICLPFLLLFSGVESLGSFTGFSSDGYFMSMLSKNFIALLVFGLMMIPAIILFIRGIHGSAKEVVETGNPVPTADEASPEERLRIQKKNRNMTLLVTLAILAAIGLRIMFFVI